MAYKPEYRRYLPHFQPPRVSFFIMGRLYGSLPQEALKRLKEEREFALRRIQKEFEDEGVHEAEIRELHKRHFTRWDQYLDANMNKPQWLTNTQNLAKKANKVLNRTSTVWQEESYDYVIRRVENPRTP
jgi:putative transposase